MKNMIIGILLSVFFFSRLTAFSSEPVSTGISEIIKSEKEEFELTLTAEGLEYPWAMAFLPGNEGMLITERTGRMVILKDGRKKYVKGVPSPSAAGQGGLLDIALDPLFEKNRYIYFTFSSPAAGGGFSTAAARGFLKNPVNTESAELENVKVIFQGKPGSSGGIHFGSRLAFGSDRSLYMTLGDRGVMSNAQNLQSHAGKVLRINPDGSIPPDNPFAESKKALPEIYSYGHRNAQGLVFDSRTSLLWLHEHGPKGGDEVNIVRRGADYGWPEVTYGVNYNGSQITSITEKEGVENPVIYWKPSIAPSGLDFYYGGVFKGWEGNLFAGALAGTHLRRMVVEGEKITHQEILLKDKIGRIRDVRTSPDGYIYILTDGKKGSLFKISKQGLP